MSWGDFWYLMVIVTAVFAIYWLARLSRAALLKSFRLSIRAHEAEALAEIVGGNDETRLKTEAHVQREASIDERVVVWICFTVSILIAGGLGALIVSRWG